MNKITTLVVLSAFGGLFPISVKAQQPVLVTQPATYITQQYAQLNGTVNPNGDTLISGFELGTTTAYGTYVGAYPSAINGGNSPVYFNASYGNLTANTTYHYRSVATIWGTSTKFYGPDVAFTTLPYSAPTITSQNVTYTPGYTFASFDVNVTTYNIETYAEFQLGLTTAYGMSEYVSPNYISASVSSGGFHTGTIYGLLTDTVYHYRWKIYNTQGTTYSNDMILDTHVPTAVNEIKGNQFTLSPNPTSGIVTLDLPAQNESPIVALTDASGKTTSATVSKYGSKYSFDISQLPAGIYFVKIYSGTNEYSQTIVKK